MSSDMVRLVIQGEDDSPRHMMERLDVCFDTPDTLLAALPFSAGDVTAGSESELQAVVAGDRVTCEDLRLS